MTFSSIPFLFYFLPVFIGLYFLLPWRNLVLLAGSLIFYAWGEPVLVLVLVLSLIANHEIGKQLVRTQARSWLIAGVVLNLVLLAGFKYAGFIGGMIGVNPVVFEGLHQPIGISFYTFQAVSYLIDLSRKDAPAPRNFIDTALYISMFPQLIAGPIVRYKSIAEQLQFRTHSFETFSEGARIFILGLAQKVLLANTFAEVADLAFDAEAGLMMGAAWIGLAAYSFQILFDFAGYSNMAIGMGLMFGFRLPQNFDFPYASQSLTEFWRRWHMTLSAWFRDYLYIPLGGNRVSQVRTYLNLWIVFLLCGLWHGAALAFIFWGTYHGAILILERVFLGEALRKLPRIFRHIYLPLVVAIGWVPFRTEDMGEALSYYGALLGQQSGAGAIGIDGVASDGMVTVMLIGAVIAFWPLLRGPAEVLVERFREDDREPSKAVALFKSSTQQIVLCILFLACTAALVGGAYNPFIYFRF